MEIPKLKYLILNLHNSIEDMSIDALLSGKNNNKDVLTYTDRFQDVNVDGAKWPLVFFVFFYKLAVIESLTMNYNHVIVAAMMLRAFDRLACRWSDVRIKVTIDKLRKKAATDGSIVKRV